MKKIFISLFAAVLLYIPSNAATYSASGRVPTVGKTILTKNNLPANTTFKVVDTEVDN